MPLIKNGHAVKNVWSSLDKDEEYSQQPNALLSMERYLEIEDTLSMHKAAIGITLKEDDDVMALKGKLSLLSIVTIYFPHFADGRAFSQARLLRERLGFQGEIRALGHIIRDQYLYLIRSGVDAIEADKVSVKEWEIAMKEFDTFYQPALDPIAPAFLKRHNNKSVAA